MSQKLSQLFSPKQIYLIIFFFLILLAAYICFYDLGKAKFDDWDEAWYAEMTKEMLNTKQFIVLQWNYDYLFDKPPLFIWLSTLFSSIFGLTEFSVRISSALTGFLTIMLSIWYSYRKWGFIPSLLTFSTLTLNNIFIWRVRSGNLDALVTFLIFLIFLIATSKWKYRYSFLGLLFGFTFLAKASIVVFPFVVFGLYELIYNFKNIIKTIPEYIKLVVIFLILVGAWLQLGVRIAGNDFMEYYVFKSDQGVSQISLNFFKTDYFWHSYYSLQRRFFFVFLFGLGALIAGIKKSSNFMILSFSTLLLLLLSFTERNNNWYLAPSFTFWSLTVGYGTFIFINLFKKQAFKIPAIVLILLLTLYVSQKTFKENIIPIMQTSSSINHVESALLANKFTEKGEAIARLDNLYPSTIYYSDRKVYSSLPDKKGKGLLFMGRKELAKDIAHNVIHVVLGKKNNVADFVAEYKLRGDVIQVNDEEAIYRSQ